MRKKIFPVIFYLLILSFPLISKEIPQKIWNPDQSTEGVTVTMKEMRRSKIRFVTVIFYRIEGSGFPSGKTYDIWLNPPGVPEPKMISGGWKVNDYGKFYCSWTKSEKPEKRDRDTCEGESLESVSLVAAGFRKGVPAVAAIISTDRTVHGYAKAVPFPMESEANGCLVRGEMISRNRFAFSGKGFVSGEMIRTVSRFGKTVREKEIQVDVDGKFPRRETFPRIKGKNSGTARFQVIGKNCQINLKYKWGDAIPVH